MPLTKLNVARGERLNCRDQAPAVGTWEAPIGNTVVTKGLGNTPWHCDDLQRLAVMDMMGQAGTSPLWARMHQVFRPQPGAYGPNKGASCRDVRARGHKTERRRCPGRGPIYS